MRRWAVIVGCLATLVAGCAAIGPRGDRSSPEQLETRQRLSQAAQAAIDRKDWEQARIELERLMAEVPRSAEVHRRLGMVLAAQGRPAEAEAAFRKALEIDPDYVDAMIGLGQVETRLGRYEAALGHLDAAIELEPEQAEAHLARGEALQALGRADEALAAYFRALEIEPTSVPTMLHVATIQLAHHQPEQALARLTQVLEWTPDDPEVRYHRGLAHLELKQIPRAIADLEFAGGRLANRPDVFYHLALALEANHQAGLALRAAERALQLAPDFANARDLSQRLRR